MNDNLILLANQNRNINILTMMRPSGTVWKKCNEFLKIESIN
jgi:hypothetical protein